MMADTSKEEDQSMAMMHLQLQRSLKWLDDVTNGIIGYELESRSLAGLQVIEARTGFLRCNFIVPILASDINGNWHVGAIATIIDNVGGAAIYSTGHYLKVTVNFNITYYSTAKIQDEVEIEAKVKGNKGKLTSLAVEVRNKSNGGQLIASATQKRTNKNKKIPKDMADDKPTLEPLLEWFEALIEGTIGQELETRALQGLIITKAEKGFIRTEFTVPSLAADVDGNWHGGAIATLMDTVGAVAIYSVFNHFAKSVDFSISYYSSAKIEEEVEINAMVLGNKGKLKQVMIEVRRKGNGDLIALAKQWMALNDVTVTTISKL
ncbi:hypothetical protein J1N35_038841 [Gossypium stocksii]|uniref:Acyl-coenzyme A thioesterase 13 n=1 Tax=Gossypium stocksii TaxID=47602 RepID=A0A9D3UMN6_9ROSI|nr:hypothetical protein J1N35_038841 [Gossypium stocksii]